MFFFFYRHVQGQHQEDTVYLMVSKESATRDQYSRIGSPSVFGVGPNEMSRQREKHPAQTMMMMMIGVLWPLLCTW